MMVKDIAGGEFNAASNAKANVGVTTGIIGTALGALNSGILNGGLLGGNNGCVVSEKQYYEDTIANMKDLFAYQNSVSQRICDLEQRVAIDETSIAKNFEFMSAQNDWQNRFFDEKFRYADLLEQCRINEATCKCIKGEVFASPSNLADPYVGRQMVIGSYALPFCQEYNAYNTGCGCSWGYNSNF